MQMIYRKLKIESCNYIHVSEIVVAAAAAAVIARIFRKIKINKLLLNAIEFERNSHVSHAFIFTLKHSVNYCVPKSNDQPLLLKK
jgi:hypothetical protein